MKKILQISLVVTLALLLLSACQGVENVGTPEMGVLVTDQHIVADEYDFNFEGDDVELTSSIILPLATPTAVDIAGDILVDDILADEDSIEALEAFEASVPVISMPAGCNASFNTDFELKVFRQINKERVNHNLPKLKRNTKLYTAARKHSIDMACNNYFSHNSPDGRTPFDRIRAAGYIYRIAAENLYAGSGSYNDPGKAVTAWMNSAAHRKNILTKGLVHIGISYVYNPDSTYGGYFTATFGAPLR